jgi:putative transposase
MKKEKDKFSKSQIVAILKEGKASVPVAQIVRTHGISAAMDSNWKSKYAGVAVAALKRLPELKALNASIANYPRGGYWKCFDRLSLQGCSCNHKRVHRARREQPRRARHRSRHGHPERSPEPGA